ncbi:MAG: formate dehydrogenase subunit gamma [Vicinamibacterales bacterium]
MSVAGRRLVRYSLGERIVHSAAAVSYVYLLLTGLAFWTPGLYWIAVVLGGGYLSRAVHPWVGLVFAAVVARMFVLWQRDMRTTDADRAWRRALRAYVSHDDARVPAAGRFNFGQKQLFWVMTLGAVGLLVSGLVLWVPQAVPRSSRWLLEAAVLVHAVTALVTIAGFIVHLYMGLVVVPGGLHAILRGDVSDAWARHHHRGWFDEQSAGDAPPRER